MSEKTFWYCQKCNTKIDGLDEDAINPKCCVCNEDLIFQEDMSEKDGDGLIQAFKDQNNIHNFEGERGVKNFEKIIRAIDSNYSSVHDFLADNSGCIEAMLEWMSKWMDRLQSSEWKENLIKETTFDPDN